MPHLCVEEHARLRGRGSFVAKLERMRSFLENVRACNESRATEAGRGAYGCYRRDARKCAGHTAHCGALKGPSARKVCICACALMDIPDNASVYVRPRLCGYSPLRGFYTDAGVARRRFRSERIRSVREVELKMSESAEGEGRQGMRRDDKVGRARSRAFMIHETLIIRVGAKTREVRCNPRQSGGSTDARTTKD